MINVSEFLPVVESLRTRIAEDEEEVATLRE